MANSLSFRGHDTSGNACCCTVTNPNCTTTVGGPLADIMGRTGPNAQFCPAPPKLNYTVQGYESTLKGSFMPSYDNTNGYRWGVKFGTQPPKGTWSIRVYSDPDLCGDVNNLRFDKTFSFKSSCPDLSTVNSPDSDFILPCKYDIIPTGSTWYLAGCPKVSVDVDISASCTNGSICQSNIYHNQPGAGAGSMQVVCKVTSYPFSITFAASGPKCLGESQTLTYNSCHDVTDDWCGGYPQVCYTEWPCAAWTCVNCTGVVGYPLPGATITVSGAFTGSGQTTDAGIADDIVTISSWVPPKCIPQPTTYWTITHPRTVGASYDDTDKRTKRNGIYGYPSIDDNGQSSGGTWYGGVFCSPYSRGIGGYAGAPAYGYSCGNCPKPLSRVLQCSILGTEVTLVKSAAESNPYGAWVGYGSWKTTCNVCKPAMGCPGVDKNGSAPFQVIWGGRACYVGQTSNTPAVYFSTAMGFGVVSECPVNPYHPDGSYAWATGCGYWSPAHNGETMVCDPLLCSGSCTQTTGVQDFCPDGTCTGWCHNYDFDLSWVITE